MGDGFIPPAPSVMDNAGAGDMREYFFRYWDTEAKPAAWSPVLPKICHSGYGGLAANPSSQFKTGATEDSPGMGGYIDGKYRLKVRYDINGALGINSENFATPVVYSWRKSDISGEKCLMPIFVPDGMATPLDARALLSGRPMTRPARIDVLPCGVLSDEEPKADEGAGAGGATFFWNAGARRFECKAGHSRRDSTISGEQLWTYVDFYLDFPNGGGLKSRVSVRRCYECRQ